MMKYLLTLILVLSAPSVWATTYYVSSGGSTNTNCTGLSPDNYDGSGTGEACAFNHPNWAMPLTANSTVSSATKNANGDTIVIVNGSYRIGCLDATDCVNTTYNTTTGGDCNIFSTYLCDPQPLADNVTVVGCSTSGCGCTYGWGGVTTCSTTRPILWGAGNVEEVIDVEGTTGVTIKDIDITDHENCNLFSLFTCRESGDMSAPNKLSAQWGILAANATNLTLTGVNIHGVGYEAMRVNNVDGMTLTGVNLNYATTGMNNDTTGSCTTCGLSGTITIDKSSANGNGCMEDWQNPGTLVDNSCCSQSQSCSSADAIGFANTGGDWVITDSDMSYNTADGPDLLYLNRGSYSGGSLTVKRTRIEGNAGNTLKGPNAMYSEDNFLISNCGFFYGKSFTYDQDSFDHCRSNTGGIAVEFKSGDASTPEFYSSTITSNGDVEFLSEGTCTTGIDFIVKGNIILGGRQWNDDDSNPWVGSGGDGKVSAYYEDGGTCNPDLIEDYNTFVGEFQEGDPHTGAHSVYESTISNVFSGTVKEGPYSSPGYFSGLNYNNELYLKSGSTAIGVSNEDGDDANDFNSFARGAAWDGGAVEYGSTPPGDEEDQTPPVVTTGGARITIGGARIKL